MTFKQCADAYIAIELIWKTIPETASRVRGRIEGILDFAFSTSPVSIAATGNAPSVGWDVLRQRVQPLLSVRCVARKGARLSERREPGAVARTPG
jgi:hypothetical protein